MISMTTKHVLELFQKLWKGYESGSMKIDELTSTVLSRTDMWGLDLNTIPGFTTAVAGYLQNIVTEGVAAIMQQLLLRQSNSSSCRI